MCLLGHVNDVPLNFGRHFGHTNSFQACTTTSTRPSHNLDITEIITTFLQEIATINERSWVVQRLPPTNPRWRTAAIYSFLKSNISVPDEDISTQFRTQMQHGADYTDNNCKTAFSLQCSRERSDGYNF